MDSIILPKMEVLIPETGVIEDSPSSQDWSADFWPLSASSTDQASAETSILMASPPKPRPGQGLTLGRLDLVQQVQMQQTVKPSSTSSSSSSSIPTPQPSPSPETKRRGSDTARKDRSNILKAYLMDVGVTKIRGARKRRKNEDGEYEGGKIDWDSEWVQEVCIYLFILLPYYYYF